MEPRFWSELVLTDHVTVVGKSPVPETLAVNCCCPPGGTVALGGLTVTSVTVGGGGPVEPVPEPPQAEQNIANRIVRLPTQ